MSLIRKINRPASHIRRGNLVEVRIYGPSPLFDTFLYGTVVSTTHAGDEVTLEIRTKRRNQITATTIPATRQVRQFI